jgi:hypothetical protein
MKTKNGYIWSDKQGRWRKLPRHVWLNMQRRQALKIAQRKQNALIESSQNHPYRDDSESKNP